MAAYCPKDRTWFCLECQKPGSAHVNKADGGCRNCNVDFEAICSYCGKCAACCGNGQKEKPATRHPFSADQGLSLKRVHPKTEDQIRDAHEIGCCSCDQEGTTCEAIDHG